MKIEILKLALKALGLNKLRSLLTTLGIVIGTMILIIVMTIGSGVKAFVLEELSVITPEILWVEMLVPSEGTRMEQNLQTAQSISAGVQIRTMKLKDVEDMKKIPNIEAGYGMTISQERLTYQGNEKIAMIFAVGEAYNKEVGGFGFELDEGRFFTDNEDKTLQQVVILGSEIKKKLFGNKEAIGENIKVKRLNFRVIGVAKEAGSVAFMDIDNIVYIPTRTVMEKILGVDYILAMGLKMADVEKTDATVAAITRQMRINHNITNEKKDDFAVRTMDEAMDILSVVTDTIELLLMMVAMISLIVGGVGIMNVMYASVTERTTEIGLKKALGAKPSAIRLQFMGEAMIITVIGGLVGILLGIALAWLMSFVARAAGFNWQFVLSFGGLLFAFSVPVGMGILFGYAPANKAANLSPIDALRETL